MPFLSQWVQKAPYVLFLQGYDEPNLILENKVFGERVQMKEIGQRDVLITTLQKSWLFYATRISAISDLRWL